MTSKRIAALAKSAIAEKKGLKPVVLDIRKVSDVADFFVIAAGSSDRHVRTLADSVVERLAKEKTKPLHVEGANDASWILVDFGDVIVHVFHHEKRKYYDLERLWGNAKVVKGTRRKKDEKPLKSSRRSSTA